MVNGVLEWVGCAAAGEGDPAAVQAAFLKELFRVLKPSGWLYMGIENRVSLYNISGGSDPHSGVRWTAVLPRRLASLWMRIKRGERYCNYLYSAWGYRRLLREAGFEKIRLLCALPGYNLQKMLIDIEGGREIFRDIFPQMLVPLGKGTMRNRLGRTVRRALCRLGLMQYLVYAYVVLCAKPATEHRQRGGEAYR